MKKLLFWKIAEKETGPYASFRKRGWPMAYYNADRALPAVRIACADSYYPSTAKSGQHAPLSVYIAFHKEVSFEWRKLACTYDLLATAKQAAEVYISVNLAKVKGFEEDISAHEEVEHLTKLNRI